MQCFYCNHPKTQVVNSRGNAKRPFIWRRRRCTACKQVFTTHETVAFTQMPAVTDPQTSTKSSLDAFRLALSIVPFIDPSQPPNDAYELSKTAIEQILHHYQHLNGTESLTPKIIAEETYTVLKRFNTHTAMQYGLKYRVIDLPAS